MAVFGKLNYSYHISMHYVLCHTYLFVCFYSSFAKCNGVSAGSQIASVSGTATAPAQDSADRIEAGVVSAASGVVSAVSRVISAVSALTSSARIAGNNISRVVSAVSGIVSTVSGIVSTVSALTTSARIAGNNVSRVVSA